ncbi:Holliday junction resolvase RecU [Mycoplasma miroungirhinis]|uniref:Holliday junction resolvase RecU n=1 Tax=Mycoplasma miroungirhinis TaxID=754516 RepID=A0A6M4JD71_9MOLU|nr:Holliday junction resolvase RecU [Mycoplasma miroungirhinis]QJR44027.1 Holliday junction resolvase RecU [Mycoplasma miroungirhinis]
MQKNRGMLLESIINKTNEKYYINKIAFCHKKELNIKFKKIVNKNEKLEAKDANIFSKSTVDYYGVYKGKFIAFEAKETDSKTFSLNNIKKHQHNYLLDVTKFGGIGFYIIFFKHFDSFLFINCLEMDKIFKNKKSLSFEEAIKISKKINLIFPGILDYVNCIN